MPIDLSKDKTLAAQITGVAMITYPVVSELIERYPVVVIELERLQAENATLKAENEDLRKAFLESQTMRILVAHQCHWSEEEAREEAEKSLNKIVKRG